MKRKDKALSKKDIRWQAEKAKILLVGLAKVYPGRGDREVPCDYEGFHKWTPVPEHFSDNQPDAYSRCSRKLGHTGPHVVYCDCGDGSNGVILK